MTIKEIMLKRESLYSKYACYDHESIRLDDFAPDIRPNFFRDIDRIIHSDSYTRYMDKTQVFSNTKNDNITKRMVHVQLVSKIGRTIGRALSLNEDLIEAIALGHDLGHVPFGHTGEAFLNKLSQEYNEGNFMHNIQSVRTMMVLENKNISIQVLDGILCHNGEFEMKEYYPKKKNIQNFLDDYYNCYQDSEYAKKLIPMTLEGCVVRISDIIAYIGRDIEDAIKLSVFDINNLPKDITNIIGNSNSQIVNNIILDIIKNSYNKNYIKLSDEMFMAITQLKKFNYQHIYHKANTEDDLKLYEEMFNSVFKQNIYNIDNNLNNCQIFTDFLNLQPDKYLNETTTARKVIDYIAGMTDDYFIKHYKQLKSIKF
ncbi:MAG: HD domain-containing protein [Bacilli bacterium]|nr:HD domain-containing protein [Bacilli bacterium]